MATKIWTGGGADELASTGLNWDTGTAPTTGDAAVFDGAFPVTGNKNCTWDITATILSIDSTGYTGLITASATMTTSGGITFANNTFAHGNQIVVLAGTQTVTPGTGNPFYQLRFPGQGQTQTISGTATVVNTCDLMLSGVDPTTINGGTLECQGDVQTTGSAAVGGTTALQFTGGANQTWASAGGGINSLAITINKSANTLTLSGVLKIGTGGFTHTAGTVDAGTSEFNLRSTSSISPGSISFYKITFEGQANTNTITGTLLATNTVELMRSGVDSQTINGGTLTCQGDIVKTGTAAVNGTTAMLISGGANQAWSQAAGANNLDITINKSGNTLTLSGTLALGGNLTYTAGTVVATGTTITKSGTKNVKSGTIAWNNFTISDGGSTTTLTGNFDVNGALTINAGNFLAASSNTINVAGNFINAGTFTRNTSTVIFDGTSTLVGNTSFNLLTFSASSVNLASSANFVAASTFTANGADANNLIVFKATTAGTRAIFRVSGGQSVSFVSATDIDSSGGNAVSNANGVISNTVNWSIPAPPVASTDTLSYIFMVA